MLRIVGGLLTITLALSGITVYGSEATTSGYRCLQAYASEIDVQTGKYFESHARGWNYKQLGESQLAQGSTRYAPLRTFYGKRFAYVEESNGNYYSGYGLRRVIASSDKEQPLKLDLPRLFSFYTPEYIWFSDNTATPTRQITWSPDGNYILVQYIELSNGFSYNGNGNWITGGLYYLTWHFLLVDIANASLKEIAAFPAPTNPTNYSEVVRGYSRPRPLWSADSRLIVFIQKSYTQRFLAHHLTGSQPVLSLMQDQDGFVPLVYEIPSAQSSNSHYLALPHFDNGQTTITLSDSRDLTNSTTLIKGAVDAGDPRWSPDGGYVAVVWATNSSSRRNVRLTWAKADGTENHTWDNNLLDIRDLVWLNDGQSLAYIGVQADGVDVETINLKTGVHGQIGSAIAQIERLTQNPQNSMLSFWWRTKQDATDIGTTGISSYTPDGKLIHSAQLSYPINGIEIFRNPYDWTRNAEIFQSPDGKVYAVRHNSIPQGVELIAADGSWSRVIYTGNPVGQYGEEISKPFWSPDSQRVTFEAIRALGEPKTRYAAAADGKTLMALTVPYYAEREFYWTDCK